MKIFFLRRYEKIGHKIDETKVSVRQAIRVNTLKIGVSALAKRLSAKGVKVTRIPFVRDGFWVESSFSLSSTPEYLFGYFYMQEAASQVPVEVLDPKPGELALDMCACPGSKTTQTAALMKNMGVIVALDSNAARLDALNNNIERLGATQTIIFQKDAQYIDEEESREMFDRVLLDAPCSGNFVIEEDWFDKRTLEDIKAKSRVQKNLLRQASLVVKKGGTIVYGTCSLEPEEDEQVVEWGLENLPLRLERIVHPASKIASPGVTQNTRECLRFWPDETGTQGFFVAKFIKI
ncbi:RsmB/NOP family class I SAM-dependent RNA methyltransferase [Candidatus Woesearchaeota archaeon]|nr:RsmB/NOP family class I SAM-dependent RNA methyltransferase [Candidatus Woesearchaeota archaeon]